MAYLKWTDELNTGIEVIDGQHRRIVTYINQLHELNERPHSAEVNEVVMALVDYTSSHFCFEESLLTDAGYTAFVEHQLEHNEFKHKIFRFRERAEANDEGVAKDLLELLNDWLFGHILHEDSQYVPILSQYLETLEVDQKTGWLERKLKQFFH